MKLAGVRVVDFSPTVPGAVVARLMADHGYSQTGPLRDFGLAHLQADADDPQRAAQQRMHAALAARFAIRTRDQWVQWFEGRDIAFAPVLSHAEALAHPHAAARGMCLRDADGVLHLATPIRFLREPAHVNLHVPGPGEDAAGSR